MAEYTHAVPVPGPGLGLLDADLESLLIQLRAGGYADRTLRRKAPILRSFAEWTRSERIAVQDLKEAHLIAFVESRSARRRSKARRTLELATLRLLLRHLRSEGRGSTPPLRLQRSPTSETEDRYVAHLRNDRGLAERSIAVYTLYIHEFLTELIAKAGSASMRALNAAVIRTFVLRRVRDRSSESSRLLVTSLRSFLRFLHFSGETKMDLSAVLPTVRTWRQASVPAFLPPSEVNRLLASVNRMTSGGRRDYAILLLLARLGLRAGEVVDLELGDIRWRTGEILVRGKGRVSNRLPLVSDVGEALARYLRQDRGTSSARQVFLRMPAPHAGLGGPAAIGHIVRSALARAAIRRTSRGAAHLLRHSLATRMIRHGASIAEIAEVLRHRSHTSTQIYAKVAFESLRGVARRWPRTGGAR